MFTEQDKKKKRPTSHSNTAKKSSKKLAKGSWQSLKSTFLSRPIRKSLIGFIVLKGKILNSKKAVHQNHLIMFTCIQEQNLYPCFVRGHSNLLFSPPRVLTFSWPCSCPDERRRYPEKWTSERRKPCQKKWHFRHASVPSKKTIGFNMVSKSTPWLNDQWICLAMKLTSFFFFLSSNEIYKLWPEKLYQAWLKELKLKDNFYAQCIVFLWKDIFLVIIIIK